MNRAELLRFAEAEARFARDMLARSEQCIGAGELERAAAYAAGAERACRQADDCLRLAAAEPRRPSVRPSGLWPSVTSETRALLPGLFRDPRVEPEDEAPTALARIVGVRAR